MKTQKTKPKAFTLIEMLIVIAIIGILTTLMVTGYMRSRLNAIDAASKSNLENTASAINMYYSMKSAYPTFTATVSTTDAFNIMLEDLQRAGLIGDFKTDSDTVTYKLITEAKFTDEEVTCTSSGAQAAICVNCQLTDGSCPNNPKIVENNYCICIR